MIHIAYCFDRNYRQHAAASIASLLLNCGVDGGQLHIHLVTDATDADFEGRLDGFRRAFKARIDVVPISEEQIAALSVLPKAEGYVSYMAAATWIRLLLPDVLPHVNRLLYLDADTIVTGDIAQLWSIDLRDAPLGGVRDAMAKAMCGHLGVPEYVNAGVLLIDLAQWRTEKLSEAAIACAHRESARIRYVDQCVINLLLRGRIRLLPPRWNMFATRRNAEQDFSSAGVIHFITEDKPWQAWYEHPAGQLYWRYLEVSPWRGAQPQAPATAAQMVRLARLTRSRDQSARIAALYESALERIHASRQRSVS
ncbi:MAG: hypothetical protein RIS35_26 [Pseudomonadota bacterium]|jgi:lipopolysaccharide biosynthesis glycosyltransferase